MAATLSRRPAKTEPRYHDAGHCLPAAGNRPWRRLQSDAAPIDGLDRGVRNGRNDCAAARAQDQTRLAPRSRMAWANPHGLRHRRRLRVPGQDLPFADQDRARHYRRPMVRTPLLRADEKVGHSNSDARQSLDRRGDAFGELCARETDAVRFAYAFEAGRDVDSIAHEVTVGFLDDVAEVNPDTKLNAAVGR